MLSWCDIFLSLYPIIFRSQLLPKITGILFQLPSGLANGGLLTFAANDNKGQQFQSYQAGFQVVLQLVAVGIGLTVGLFTSVVIVHPLGGSRGRAAGIFSL